MLWAVGTVCRLWDLGWVNYLACGVDYGHVFGDVVEELLLVPMLCLYLANYWIGSENMLLPEFLLIVCNWKQIVY